MFGLTLVMVLVHVGLAFAIGRLDSFEWCNQWLPPL